MTFYNTIFQRSWEITRKHKVLWLFGLFVLFWGGKSIDFEVFFTNADLLQSPFSPFRPEFWQVNQWTLLAQQYFPSTVSLAGLVMLIVAVALFVLALIMFSQVGLIDAFGNHSKRKKDEKYSMTNAIDTGRVFFGRVLGVNLLGKGISYGLVGLASTPLFLAQLQSSQLLYTAFLFLILTPVAVLVSVLTKYAVNDIVLHDHSLTQAVLVAWQTFTKNVGVSIELAIIMFVAYLGATIAAIVTGLLLTLPLYFFGLIHYANTGGVLGVGLFQVFLYLAVALLLTFVSMVFSAWHFGNWTLLFQELTSGAKRSKIHRIWKK